jgi:catecholate siderophore receptor
MAVIKSRKHSPASPFRLPAIAALASLSLPLAAHAQSTAPASQASAAPALPAVKVQGGAVNDYKPEQTSSPKFTQPLLETPQTITVIKKELLQDQGASTLSEALRNTPGITFTLGENGNTTTGDSIFMRGFDTSNSIYVDGIRDLGGITRDTFNIEQVEVVKGPSGADNGRGAPTGYINLSSKVPQAANLSSGSATLGSGSRVRATADLNRKLDIGIPGAAFRLNVMGDRSDEVGRNVAKNRSVGVAPSLAFGLGTPTRTYFSLLHVDQDNVPDGGLPTIGWPGYNYSPATTLPAGQQAAVKAAVDGAGRVDTHNFYGAATDHDKVQANMLTARIEHDLSAATTLRNTSRYGRTRQQYELTGINALGNLIDGGVVTPPSTWTAARSRQGKDQSNEILVNQTNLTTAFKLGGLKNTLSTGLEVIHERQDTRSFTGVGTTDAANLYNPSTSGAFAPIVASGASNNGSTTTVALYAFDNVELTPQWELNAGLRLERYRTRFNSVGAPAIVAGNTVPTQVATELNVADQLATGKLGVVFKPASNGTVYVSYATSQQPPGGANFTLSATAANINNPNVEPQKASTIEAGTKWDLLDNRLVLTTAVYQTTNKNDLVTADAVTGEITQFGKRKVKGVEFGAAGAITAAWQVSAGLALMDTQVTQGTATQTGASANFSPDQSFTAWSTYKLPMGLTVGGGARYLSSQTTSVNNGAATNLAEIPSYWVLDAMAGYQVNKNVSLQLNLANLSDKVYLASVNNGRSRYTLGQRRAAQLTANVTF